MSGIAGILIQIGCQEVGSAIRRLYHLGRTLSLAHPEALEFWSAFKPQYELLLEIFRAIDKRYNGQTIRRQLRRELRRLARKATQNFNRVSDDIEKVLRREGL